MNLLQGDVTSNIPLSCNVCPRRPDFSDVSHLLTHIQSKGHLSAYYKLKVKGTSDPAAQRTIDDFDEWYADYGLEELMRERMSQKDKKKAGSGSASRRSTSTCVFVSYMFFAHRSQRPQTPHAAPPLHQLLDAQREASVSRLCSTRSSTVEMRRHHHVRQHHSRCSTRSTSIARSAPCSPLGVKPPT